MASKSSVKVQDDSDLVEAEQKARQAYDAAEREFARELRLASLLSYTALQRREAALKASARRVRGVRAKWRKAMRKLKQQ